MGVLATGIRTWGKLFSMSDFQLKKTLGTSVERGRNLVWKESAKRIA